MTHNVAAALQDRMMSVDDLIHLPDNPRRSDTAALAESYQSFGQLKALIGVPDEDSGKVMIVSGNHQLRAARDELGWTHVAVDVHEDLTAEQIAAFVVLENHWGNIGDVDDVATLSLIEQSGQQFVQMFDMVGYDEMALASLENTVIMADIKERVDPNAGWNPPERLDLNTAEEPFRVPVQTDDAERVTQNDDGDRTTPVATEATTESIVTQGSGVVAPGTESKKAVIQYTLVFDDDEQQRAWYNFIRWIRSSSVYDGDTTAQLLINFIQAHSEV